MAKLSKIAAGAAGGAAMGAAASYFLGGVLVVGAGVASGGVALFALPAMLAAGAAGGAAAGAVSGAPASKPKASPNKKSTSSK